MDTATAAQWPPQVKAMERKMRKEKGQALKCPRCNSGNTKFCYYNNYSLSQPRYFCKSCRRYWTEGGSLRNIPVGGGSRKPRPSSSKIHNLQLLPQNPNKSQDLNLGSDINIHLPSFHASSSPSPFPTPDFKPSLGFSLQLQGLGGAFGSFQEPNGKLLFPFEDFKSNADQIPDHNSNANAYWDGVLGGGGSW